jgi:hypothetical protein
MRYSEMIAREKHRDWQHARKAAKQEPYRVAPWVWVLVAGAILLAVVI